MIVAELAPWAFEEDHALVDKAAGAVALGAVRGRAVFPANFSTLSVECCTESLDGVRNTEAAGEHHMRGRLQDLLLVT